jgi:hypothetical protein
MTKDEEAQLGYSLAEEILPILSKAPIHVVMNTLVSMILSINSDAKIEHQHILFDAFRMHEKMFYERMQKESKK